MSSVQVQIWSDVLCPWCAIGLTHLDEALVGLHEEVEIVWRSFELDPSSPRVSAESLSEALGRKYGRSPSEIDAMMSRVTEVGASRGLRLDFSNARPGNSFDAHRLLHLAKEHGVQMALKRALFQAYFSDGVAIGDPVALASIAESVGLPPDLVEEVLRSDRYAEEVRADEAQARSFGIRSVPTFVFGGRVAVSGAQPAEVLRQAMAKATTLG
ncbi:MAG: DsbA family oxidoreductase [Deltaproteobacteria bacterium]|nr:MAG: DsbA family oxidoreductase [Deltaproteobacteria bacterium]